MMASEEGGTEIEEVAAETPEKIFKEVIDPGVGLSPFQARRLAFNLNIPKELIGKVVKFMIGLYEAFVDKDCSKIGRASCREREWMSEVDGSGEEKRAERGGREHVREK